MKALIAVDVQRDFLPGGALAIPKGDRVLTPLAQEMRQGSYRVIVLSRDAHPVDHCSFVCCGGGWPVHCVDGTEGAEIHPLMLFASRVSDAERIFIDKATESDKDAYSAFEGTTLAQRLRKRKITEIVVGGLATEYCVKATVLDALREGFQVKLLASATAAVDNADAILALAEMTRAGAEVTLP